MRAARLYTPAFSSFLPYTVSVQLLVNALIAGSFAALMAAGLSMVYGVLGVFNMALGQIALAGGYGAWWLLMKAGLPFPFAVLGGAVIAAFVTWLSFELFVAPFYKRHRFLPLVTTIALSMILDGILLYLFKEDPKSISTGGKHLVSLGNAVMSLEQGVLVLITVVFLSALAWILVGTPFGRRIRATVEHPSAAESLGINAPLLHRLVFIMSGVLAGFAGIYLGIDQNLTPVLGFAITIKAYAALIAGGKKSLWGTILCAYGIALLEQLSIGVPWFGGHYIAAGFQNTVALLMIIVILLWKPEGIFGSRTRTA